MVQIKQIKSDFTIRDFRLKKIHFHPLTLFMFVERSRNKVIHHVVVTAYYPKRGRHTLQTTHLMSSHKVSLVDVNNIIYYHNHHLLSNK